MYFGKLRKLRLEQKLKRDLLLELLGQEKLSVQRRLSAQVEQAEEHRSFSDVLGEEGRVSDKQQETILKIANLSDIKRGLSYFDKTPNDLLEIFKHLLAIQVGMFRSSLIVSHPRLLNYYLNKKGAGMKDEELGVYLLDLVHHEMIRGQIKI